MRKCAHLTQEHIAIIFMSRSDIANVGGGTSSVCRIENETASPGTRWSEDDFLRELSNKNTIGQVAHVNGEVVGFMFYNVEEKKIHLIHMSVAKAYQRKGIGSAMLDKLKAKLTLGRREAITVAVRETLLPAHLFLKKNKFLAFKVKEKAFVDTEEAAYLFKFEIPSEGGYSLG